MSVDTDSRRSTQAGGAQASATEAPAGSEQPGTTFVSGGALPAVSAGGQGGTTASERAYGRDDSQGQSCMTMMAAGMPCDPLMVGGMKVPIVTGTFQGLAEVPTLLGSLFGRGGGGGGSGDSDRQDASGAHRAGAELATPAEGAADRTAGEQPAGATAAGERILMYIRDGGVLEKHTRPSGSSRSSLTIVNESHDDVTYSINRDQVKDISLYPDPAGPQGTADRHLPSYTSPFWRDALGIWHTARHGLEFDAGSEPLNVEIKSRQPPEGRGPE